MGLMAKRIPPREHYLIEEINRTKTAMETAYSNFQNVIDPDLIDSCIYEMNAAQTRYRFLVRLAKASNINYG